MIPQNKWTKTQYKIKAKAQALKELSKSGIVFLVLFSVVAGYLIGQPSELAFDFLRFLKTLIALLLVSAGSSALNQLQEEKIDAQMPRTALRPIPTARISKKEATLFIIFTLTTGLYLLKTLSAELFYLGIAAVFAYNFLYTLWWKKHWAFAAIPGAIPGALPILMGHLASQGKVLNPGGIYLFAILFFWQMPHFWVLALRYSKDYEQGGIPTLPVTYGAGSTTQHILLWCLAYIGIALIAPLFLPVGWIYQIPCLLICGKLALELRRFVKNPDRDHWFRFFMWVNSSLILFLFAAVIDLWSVYFPFIHGVN